MYEVNKVNSTPPLSQKQAFYYLTQQQQNQESDSDFDISNDLFQSQHSKVIKTSKNCIHRNQNKKQQKKINTYGDISYSSGNLKNNQIKIYDDECKTIEEIQNGNFKQQKSQSNSSSASKKSADKPKKLELNNDYENYELVIPPCQSHQSSPDQKQIIKNQDSSENKSIQSTPLFRKVNKLAIFDEDLEDESDSNKIKIVQTNLQNKISNGQQLEEEKTKNVQQIQQFQQPIKRRLLKIVQQTENDDSQFSEQQCQNQQKNNKNNYNNENENNNKNNTEDSEEIIFPYQFNNKKRKKLVIDDLDEPEQSYQELNLFTRKKVRLSTNNQQNSQQQKNQTFQYNQQDQIQLFKIPHQQQQSIQNSNSSNEIIKKKDKNIDQQQQQNKDIIYTQQNNMQPFKRLKKLQKGKHLSQNSNSENVCSICLDVPKDNLYGILKCTHKFCAQCILDWAEVTNLCPNCRKEFTQIEKRDFNNSDSKPQIIPVQKKKQRVHNDEEYDEDEDEEDDIEEFIEDDLIDDNCYVCQKSDNCHLMLICDLCNIHICHTYCDNRIPDGLIPEGDWICSYCDENLESNECSDSDF